MEKFYITTAIAYASQKPHFGNTFEVIMTDAIARYKRQRGFDVYFLTGTDEHGQKIENKALEAGISPKEYVDGVASQIRSLWDLMGASYSHFIRTTDENHEKSVQHIFKKLYDQGDIYKDHYEGWYCTPCESFFTQTQLVDGKCPDCGREVTKTREEAYFFRMSAYADRLLDYINSHPEFIEPESRKKEMINNFIIPGLQDLCISRSSFKWGIPVPVDPKHVIYVWLDALSNYITALGYDPENEVQPETFTKNWPADVHVIGKDIARFHTIYWPIFLMALGLELPKKVICHPWFLFGTDKMSKSRGNVIYADELAKYLSVDGVRYYALAEMPYANDGSITYESAIARYNTDLANNLGNLVNRTIAMTKKYFDGIVPERGEETELDRDLAAVACTARDAFVEKMDSYHIADAIEEVLTLLRRANKYIDETMPWILAKNESDRARLGSVMYNLLEAIRFAAVLLTPVIPSTCEKVFAQLGTDLTDYASIVAFASRKPGEKVGEASVLFSRLDEEKTLAEIAEVKASEHAEAEEKPEGLAEIAIDDFAKVELRCAEVVSCEPIPKAKKLLKLQLDLGYEKRQVASGIAKFYKPEELIGKKVVLVANLKPAVLCGVESCGMILASSDKEGTVRVIFLDPETPNGAEIH